MCIFCFWKRFIFISGFIAINLYFASKFSSETSINVEMINFTENHPSKDDHLGEYLFSVSIYMKY